MWIKLQAEWREMKQQGNNTYYNGQGNFRKFVFEALKYIYIFFLLWTDTKTGLFLIKSGISKGNITARDFLYHPITEEVC